VLKAPFSGVVATVLTMLALPVFYSFVFGAKEGPQE